MTRACLILLATLQLASQLPAADFVVAPDGDDRNTGTAQKPFASIQRAQAAARVRIADGLTSDLVIELRGGRYVLDEPLVFNQRDSGTERHRVVYAAAEGGVGNDRAFGSRVGRVFRHPLHGMNRRKIDHRSLRLL